MENAIKIIEKYAKTFKIKINQSNTDAILIVRKHGILSTLWGPRYNLS